MITIGVDFSKRTSVYHVLDEKGCKIKHCKLENRPETIQRFLETLPGRKQLALEATRNWGLYHDCIKDYVDRFHLGHPKKMKAITESEIKNDQRDAELIAGLTYSGFLPEAHVSSQDTRQLRSLVRFRGFLVRSRASIRNQVQTLLDRNLWPCQRPSGFKNIFCQRGLRWLEAVPLAPRERLILDECLKSYQGLSQRILTLDERLEQESLHLAGLESLRTVPGFKRSRVNSLIVLLEADGIERFRKARGFAHYAGLVPREFSSGEKHRSGRLVKGANLHLRTALIESTLAAIRADQGLRAYYKQVKDRRGSGAAIVATARKLAYAVYWVLKEQRPYRGLEGFTVPPAAACHSSSIPLS
jgi:transposase